MSRIIAIANQKGGVGKTTTAVNLSACLAAQGHRILLVDLDPQGNSSSGYGIEKHTTAVSTYDVLINEMPLEQAVRRTMLDTLDILPASVDLAGAEVELVSAMGREYMLKQRLDDARDTYRWILIDCPPSLGLLTLNALTAADSVLVPIQCEFYAMEGLTQLMNTVELVRKRLNRKLTVEGIVLTMYDARTNLSVQVAEDVRRHYDERVFSTVIPRNVRLSEAPSHGLPITLYDPTCAGTTAYKALARELLEER